MKNEAGNIAALAAEIGAACEPIGPFEAIFVDDGSDDATPQDIAAAQGQFPWLRSIRHAESCGQSAAILTAVRAANAPLIAMLDGDGQNPPLELPNLLAPFLAEGADPTLGLVAGQRVGRKDTGARRWASSFANGLRRRILKDDTRDTGCGLKAFRREAFMGLPFFDHIHRYLPALMKREGWQIALVDVTHRERSEGASKYTNFGRAMVGILDLYGVWWLMRRRKRPRIEGQG